MGMWGLLLAREQDGEFLWLIDAPTQALGEVLLAGLHFQVDPQAGFQSDIWRQAVLCAQPGPLAMLHCFARSLTSLSSWENGIQLYSSVGQGCPPCSVFKQNCCLAPWSNEATGYALQLGRLPGYVVLQARFMVRKSFGFGFLVKWSRRIGSVAV